MKNRRDFLMTAAAASCYGMFATTSGYANLITAPKQLDPIEEARKKKNATHTIPLASPYANEDWRITPTAQLNLKANIEEKTNGAVFVEVFDKGQLGVGTEVLGGVARGLIGIGLVSISNISPLASFAELLNIPFWSAKDQEYLNLITSPYWQKEVRKNLNKNGLDLLFQHVVGARTISTTQKMPYPIRIPDEMNGVMFRVPASKILERFYEAAGANPIKIPWGLTGKVASLNRFDALDPGITGLFAGPNDLRKYISTINKLATVHDGWAMIVNRDWLQSLPPTLKSQVREAAELTFREQLALSSAAQEFCEATFESLGTVIHTPSDDERAAWVHHFGPEKPLWDEFKKNTLEKISDFDKLIEATQQNNGYHI